MPGDDEILAAAREAIEALNARADGDGARQDRFFLFHRVRQWNPGEGVWMGWERKRGKIEELNRLLRGATDTSIAVQVGALELLPRVRYCITLDSDTRLPRDAARTLVGIAAHPLNRPRFDAASGRVVEGYGILQPRVSVTMASAAGSLFARLYSGHTGVDPYTTAVSDTYQDLFAEGIFTGKGLYDVDAFIAALEGRVPENALLSHDLFEGLFARTALVSDVELVDDYPSSVLAHARRQHRWVRGDWQILLWLFPWMPTAQRAARAQPAAAHLALEDLRQPAPQPGRARRPRSLLLVGLDRACPETRRSGRRRCWARSPSRVLPLLLAPARAGRRSGRPGGVFLRAVGGEIQTALARAGLQVAFLASEASEMVHAIGLTLVRMLVTQRRLLEWETAARERRPAAWLARAARLRPRDGRRARLAALLGIGAGG